jgi:site-specific recombinase XerD
MSEQPAGVAVMVRDVWRDGACLSTLRITRSRLKGGRGARARGVRSREIPLNERAREFITRYLQEREQAGPLYPLAPLFPSNRTRRGLSRCQAWRIIRHIFLGAGLDPAKTWSGHSLRRRFVRRVFDLTDLETARICAGHASALCTAGYLFVGETAAVQAMLEIGRIARTATGGLVAGGAVPAALVEPAALRTA